MPKHIMFQQRQNDTIFYITDEMENMSFMKYKEFIKFLGQSFYIDDWQPMIHALDCFDKVFVDMYSKTWKKIVDDNDEYGFEELFDLNKPEEPEVPFHTRLSNSVVDLYNKIGRKNIDKI